MLPKLRQSEINQVYSALPSNSKGWKADNPEWFKYYLDPQGSNPWNWPHIALCRERGSAALTWHVLCEDFSDWEILFDPDVYDREVSNLRNRDLDVIEFYSEQKGKRIGFYLLEDDLERIRNHYFTLT